MEEAAFPKFSGACGNGDEPPVVDARRDGARQPGGPVSRSQLVLIRGGHFGQSTATTSDLQEKWYLAGLLRRIEMLPVL